MGTLKAKPAKTLQLSDPRPSSYLELPPGVHTVGDKKYTVVEIEEPNYDGNGTYKRNVIDLIEPVTPETPAV